MLLVQVVANSINFKGALEDTELTRDRGST